LGLLTSRSNIPKGTHPEPAFIDGATAPGNSIDGALETELDFEIAYRAYSDQQLTLLRHIVGFANSVIAIVYPQTTTDYQTNYSQYDVNTRPGIFNTFLDAIDGSYCTYSSNNETGDDPNIDPVYPPSQLQCGVYAPTNVISLSYGLVERDYPDYYQIRQCNEFMKLALQGVTIVAASGDNGVMDRLNATCLGPNKNAFVPNYPSCPYITLVGATELPSGSSPGDPETAPTLGSGLASGGGFSNIFAQPSYQADAVNSSVRYYIQS
jgi:tripeptidyl-peptidase I